jgi:hypothetical protein
MAFSVLCEHWHSSVHCFCFCSMHPGGNKLDGLTLMQRKRQSYVSVKSTSGGISDVHISARGLTGLGICIIEAALTTLRGSK